ncbi:MAG: ATP-binding protein [Gammaproteobacteria bacterium]|nr:ATP-binding protein [Gammaproteobacteria bacterium]
MRIKQQLLIILGIGLSVSFLITGMVFRYEFDGVEEDFGGQVIKATEDIRESLQDIVIADDKLSFLFQVTDGVSDEDFLVNGRALLSQIPYLKKIVYAPKIRKTHLIAEEKKLQSAGYTGFKFRSFLPPEFAESGLSDAVYPVEFIEPFNPYTSIWFGRDLMTFLPASNVLHDVILNTKKMQIVWPENMNGNTGKNDYYLFSSVTFLDYMSNVRSEKTEDVIGVLAYKIELEDLLAAAIVNENIATHISLNDHQILSKGVFNDNFFMTLKRTETIVFEGQDIRLQFQLIDPLMRVDYRISSLVLFVGILITALIYFVVRAHLERHQLLNEQNVLIENKVTEKTKLLKLQAQQINVAYDHQLAITRELEAFSYSISHDLRAPLRSISGFANALNEDYQKQIDTEGKDMLQRVQRGAEKMSMLIDDLLSLSKVSRQKISDEQFSISNLFDEKVVEFQDRYPDRYLNIKVEKNLEAQGDHNLVRIVLDNLLDNAIKYSSASENPTIEFGVIDKEGKQAYFVRDNGVGFDMAYANKLFIAFQRLHGDEFEGTGIGLATVQRIINRHGGKVWAESELGKGATFYFTLG